MLRHSYDVFNTAKARTVCLPVKVYQGLCNSCQTAYKERTNDQRSVPIEKRGVSSEADGRVYKKRAKPNKLYHSGN